jgi:hypothetical protein
MNEHLPECELTEPCSPDTPKHGFCSRQSTYCIHCERACICERLRNSEKQIIAEAKRIIAGFLGMDDTGERRCSDPACDLCIVAPLIYAALKDLILSKGDQP